MTFDLNAWKSPRDLDVEQAEALLTSWHDMGGDPGQSPFEPSTDVGWFHQELVKDVPALDVSSDAGPNASAGPIWLAGIWSWLSLLAFRLPADAMIAVPCLAERRIHIPQ